MELLHFLHVKGKGREESTPPHNWCFMETPCEKSVKIRKKGLAFSNQLWDNVCVKIAIKGITAPFYGKLPHSGLNLTLFERHSEQIHKERGEGSWTQP